MFVLRAPSLSFASPRKGSPFSRHFATATDIQASRKTFSDSFISTPVEKLSPESVCTVFGCTGFVGKYIVSRLGENDVQIIAPYRGEEKYARDLKVMGDVGQIGLFNFNIRDPQTVEKAVSHSQFVVNSLGSHVHTRNFSLHQANVETARTIAQAAKKAGVSRFVHLSCVGASKDSPSALLRAKAEAEEVVKQIIPSATILRSTVIFGSEDRFISKLGSATRNTPVFLLPVRGSSLVQPVHVLDVVSAVVAVLEAEDTAGKTYELGGPHIFRIGELVENVILQMVNSQMPLLELKKPLNELYALITENTRKCLWTRDEIKYYEANNLVSENALTLADLKISPSSVFDRDLVFKMLQNYRYGPNAQA